MLLRSPRLPPCPYPLRSEGRTQEGCSFLHSLRCLGSRRVAGKNADSGRRSSVVRKPLHASVGKAESLVMESCLGTWVFHKEVSCHHCPKAPHWAPPATPALGIVSGKKECWFRLRRYLESRWRPGLLRKKAEVWPARQRPIAR